MSGCKFGRYRIKYHLCEYENSIHAHQQTNDDHIKLFTPRQEHTQTRYIDCPDSHRTHSFLACDASTECWGTANVLYGSHKEDWDIPSHPTCPAPVTPLPPSFACGTERHRVPYTFVCDHRQDCADSSGEEWCLHAACPADTPLQCGTSRQCYTVTQSCDGQEECINGYDEGNCKTSSIQHQRKQQPPRPPATIDFTKNGAVVIKAIENLANMTREINCPETHYQCPGDGYCLPIFTRCNGYNDCPNKEDEWKCDHYRCPGYHHCFGSHVCVHHSHICDGIYHCPRGDDELLCNRVCPPGCRCHGLAFTCLQSFPAHFYPYLRYLNGRSSGLTFSDLSENSLLIYISLASCGLSRVVNVSFPNARTIDLSHNKLTALPAAVLDKMSNLKTLFLSNNDLSSAVGDVSKTFRSIHILDLSLNVFGSLNEHFVQAFSSVEFLNLSQCNIYQVRDYGFQPMKNLRVLDMRGCPMSDIQDTLFKSLRKLRAVYSDNYKLCCAAAFSADFNPKDCFAPQDEISSCQDLLRSGTYRVFLAVLNFQALLGNAMSFLFRAAALKGGKSSGYNIFILHLCVSDFLMGVYLAIIGVTDRIYQNVYVWHETFWRKSVGCKIAGCLSLLSCEVSAFIVCLITLDRLLVVRFPLSFLRFSKGHAHIASCMSWMIGLSLSAIPFLPSLHHWEFYSQTSICIPLPVTRISFAGKNYSFAVMVVLNFILFLVIGLGQLVIYLSVRSNRLSDSCSGQQSKDMDIARRLLTIALSDFMCWFPVGLLGILASRNVLVPGEVSIALAIIVMPLNSAINPFLYTMNIITEKRRKMKEEKLYQWFRNNRCAS